MNRKFIIFAVVVLFIFCAALIFLIDQKNFIEKKAIRIGINPWPGYEFIYLAEKKGFFEDEGINLKTVQFSSLQDVRQAYERGQVDGMCSTIVEMLQANLNIHKRSKIVLVTDYSDGADVILANKSIKTIADLKGKRVAIEPLTLGNVVLLRALEKYGMSLSEVEVLNIALVEMEKKLSLGNVDAVVAYPPFSIGISKRQDVLEIFSTKEIPREIVDVISFDPKVLDENPDLVPIFKRVWKRVLNYASQNKEEAYSIMAQREGLSLEEFEKSLLGIHIVSSDEQEQILGNDMQNNISVTLKMLSKVSNADVSPNPRDFVYEGQ